MVAANHNNCGLMATCYYIIFNYFVNKKGWISPTPSLPTKLFC